MKDARLFVELRGSWEGESDRRCEGSEIFAMPIVTVDLLQSCCNDDATTLATDVVAVEDTAVVETGVTVASVPVVVEAIGDIPPSTLV